MSLGHMVIKAVFEIYVQIQLVGSGDLFDKNKLASLEATLVQNSDQCRV